MAGFTYSTLTTAIQNYTEVGTGVLSSTITDQFIDNSELRIQREIPIDADRKEMIGNLVASKDNVYERSHGRDTSDTVRFRGPIWTSSDPDGFQNPVDFDGISGSNIANSSGYSITVGKRDSDGDVTATDNFYYFTVDTDTATSGGVSGGGNNCSAGPATLEA